MPIYHCSACKSHAPASPEGTSANAKTPGEIYSVSYTKVTAGKVTKTQHFGCM